MSEIRSKELRWIEEEPVVARPSFKGDSDLKPKKPYIKRLMDGVITPICLFATVGCLTFGLANLVKGDVQKQQYFMRGRVICQGAALVTMLVGTTAVRNAKARQEAEIEAAEKKAPSKKLIN